MHTMTLPENGGFSDTILAKAQDGGTFTDNDVTPDLSREAGAFLRSYTGNFAFLQDMQASVVAARAWRSRAQVRGVLNCMLAEARRAAPTHDPAAAATRSATSPAEVRDGTYTIALPGDASRTLRVSAGAFADGTPVQWVALLTGPNNDGDYQGIGYLVRGSYRWTRRFAGTSGPLADAVAYLVNADARQQQACGETYAAISGNCWICARTLTTLASLSAGYGPTCAAHYGLPYGAIDEEKLRRLATV